MNKTKRFEALYAQVPEGFCKGLCHVTCGPVALTRWERARLTGGPPIPLRQDGMCPHLTEENRCGVYEQRPLVCRLLGATVKLPCPFGCSSDAPLSADHAANLIDESVRIGGENVGMDSDDPYKHIRELVTRMKLEAAPPQPVKENPHA